MRKSFNYMEWYSGKVVDIKHLAGESVEYTIKFDNDSVSFGVKMILAGTPRRSLKLATKVGNLSSNFLKRMVLCTATEK